MSSFQDLGVFVHNNPQAEVQRRYAHAGLNDKPERESMRVTSLGFYLRVIANLKPLNLEKTISVLLLIYACMVYYVDL